MPAREPPIFITMTLTLTVPRACLCHAQSTAPLGPAFASLVGPLLGLPAPYAEGVLPSFPTQTPPVEVPQSVPYPRPCCVSCLDDIGHQPRLRGIDTWRFSVSRSG